MAAAHILKQASCGNGNFTLDVYPSSQPVYLDLVRKGAVASLLEAGAIFKTAFCGPCFGAGDTPANNAFSIRHTTRNFPNREGSKPGNGQFASVALMDARSIAATAANGGVLTSAEGYMDDYVETPYDYDDQPYATRVYQGFGQADEGASLVYGPNIKDCRIWNLGRFGFAQGLLEDHGPGHDDRRTHPVWRNVVVPLQSPGPG